MCTAQLCWHWRYITHYLEETGPHTIKQAPYSYCLATMFWSFVITDDLWRWFQCYNYNYHPWRSQVVRSTIFYPLPCKFFLEFTKGGSLNLSYGTVFLINMNELGTCVTTVSKPLLLVDDIKCYNQVSSTYDSVTLQHDLESINYYNNYILLIRVSSYIHLNLFTWTL